VKRWIELAAALYPARWRAEYGEEFEEVLANAPANWRTLRNVLRGAIAMQVTKGTSWMKWMAASAALGIAIAAVLSFTLQPAKYASYSTLEIQPQQDPVRPSTPHDLQQRTASRLAAMQQEILSSRTTLQLIIQDPKLDLYKTERQRLPMEKIVEQMRNDIHVHVEPVGDALQPIRFSIVFDYPSPLKAQAVTRALVAKFTEQNVQLNRIQEHLYHSFWTEMRNTGEARTDPPPPPVGEQLSITSVPSVARPTGVDRTSFLATGAIAGALLGVLLAQVRQRPHGVWMLASAGAAGLLIAGALSYLVPDRNTSRAVMHVVPPMVMADPLATPPAASAADLLRKVEPQIVSGENLERIIQKLSLYPDEPPQQAAKEMRERDLHIAAASAFALPGDAAAFDIAFTYPNPQKAQEVVRQFVAEFTEQNVVEQRAKARNLGVVEQQIADHKVGETLEVLDPASLPHAPDSPNRPAIAAAGAVLGLLVGLIALRRFPMRISPPQLPVEAGNTIAAPTGN
jgi:uncharacterized protein involved in exopolysaccharide biosynthesis